MPTVQHNRVIRVFISSTFRDMQAERDHLLKFIFPELRKLCESRSVQWGEVDLRWGITDEQKSEGRSFQSASRRSHDASPISSG